MNKFLKFLVAVLFLITLIVVFSFAISPLLNLTPDYYARGLVGAITLSEFIIFFILAAIIPVLYFAARASKKYPKLKWLWQTLVILHLIASALIIFPLPLGVLFFCVVCEGWRGMVIFVVPAIFASLLFLTLKNRVVGQYSKLKWAWWIAMLEYLILSVIVALPTKATGAATFLVFNVIFGVVSYGAAALIYSLYVSFLNLVLVLLLLKWFVRGIKNMAAI